MRKRLLVLTEIALMTALALILDLVIPSLHGLKITIKMMPIFILAYRRGILPATAAGLLWSILQITVGDAYILNVYQVLIEYLLAFSVLGLAGVAYRPIQKELRRDKASPLKLGLLACGGIVLASLLRYILHFAAGILFWADYAPAGQTPAFYSLTVNGGAFLSETLTCLVFTCLLLPVFKPLLLNRDARLRQ